MSILVKIVAAATSGGVVIGGLLGVLTADDAAPATLGRDAVTVYACPGEGAVGTLHRGDRILVIGRNEQWLAVRNVRGAGEQVFIAAEAVVADDDLDWLPQVDCADAGTLAVTPTTPAPTTAVVDTTMPDTTVPDSTPDSTSPPAAPTTTRAPTASTTTIAAPTTTIATTTTLAPPTVVSVLDSPDPIWESYTGSDCGDGIATVTASISAPAGVASVVLSWTSTQGNGSTPMSKVGGTYRATIGPFGDTFVGNGQVVVLTYTVKVTDNLGRQHSRQGTITVDDCPFG